MFQRLKAVAPSNTLDQGYWATRQSQKTAIGLCLSSSVQDAAQPVSLAEDF